MAVGFLSISVEDEQEAVDRLQNWLVNTIGWTVAQDVTDTDTDRDIVLKSVGEPEVLNPNDIYIRLRGTSNNIVLYTYETFTDISTNTGEVSDATYGLINVNVGSQGFFLQVVGDLERAYIHIESYSSTHKRFGYVGRILSYYTPDQHPYPNLVKGGQNNAYDWYYSSNERNSWMIANDDTVQHYYGVEPNSLSVLRSSQASDRNGKVFMSAPILVNDSVDSNAELVGEPRGVYRISPEVAAHNTFFPIEDRLYIVLESNADVNMVVGPVTASGIEPPSLSTEL